VVAQRRRAYSAALILARRGLLPIADLGRDQRPEFVHAPPASVVPCTESFAPLGHRIPWTSGVA
jgi:hypothetical protein